MPDQPREATRLYLVTPLDYPAETLVAVLESFDVACVLLHPGDADQEALGPAIARLCPLAQERDVAFLVEDAFEAAAEAGCDGVHLSAPTAYEAARRRLGESAIVGVGCGNAREAALLAAEAGADYVAFGAPEPSPAKADPELLTWWQTFMTPPCVGFGAADPEDCAALAVAGADFVALDAALWADPQRATAALGACARAIAEATETA